MQQPAVTDRMALGCIGVDLAAIDTDGSQLQHAQLMSDDQYLGKQVHDFGQKGLAKVGDGVMVWMVAARKKSERDRFQDRIQHRE